MGTVFMAEQEKPVRRKVALKVIKPGMDSAQVVARFEAERQALAMMDHPNIARMLDVGTTDTGRPFFVMELVRGVPITEYCDANHLTPRERLELFVPVCQAIQHAHQKGIIHRDLKPSNVLVTLHDGVPVPKVIDFGVAKAIDQRLTERTLFTQFGAVVGTPEYMSPEQAGMSGLDIDTRSDIYSLGVLLYELLTGGTPLQRARLRQAAFSEVLRRIREEEPPRPSTRLSTTEELPTIAVNRKTEPAKLARLVRGELDWIVMKCLEKDRTRRYETANGLARDLQRYLADEPVEAGPPSAGYRLRKLIRRHKGPVTAAALLLLALVAGIAGTTWGMVRADRERQAAARERDEKGKALAAEQKARARTREALDEMSSQVIGDWLARQGEPTPQQRAFLEKALRFYEEFAAETGDDEPTRAGVADAHLRLATILARLGRPDAVRAAERAEGLFTALSERSPSEPRYRGGLADSIYRQARNMLVVRPEESTRLFLRAIGLAERLVADDPENPALLGQLAQMLNSYAGHIQSYGRNEEALRASDRALTIQRRLVAADPADDRRIEILARILNNREVTLVGLGRDAEAHADLQESLPLFEKIAGRSPSMTEARVAASRMRNNLGITLTDERRYEEAVVEYRKAEEWLRPLVTFYPSVPGYREWMGVIYICWAGALLGAKEFPEAAAMAERAIRVWEQLPESPGRQFNSKNGLGSALRVVADCRSESGDPTSAVGDYDRAIRLIREAQAVTGSRQYTIADLEAAFRGRARALDWLGRHTEALADWETALGYASKSRNTPAYELLAGKATTLAKLGRRAEAEPLISQVAAAPADEGEAFFVAATAAALLAGADADSVERKEKAQAQGIAFLRRAHEAGLFRIKYWANRLKSDRDLAALRDRADYRQLVADLEKESAPGPQPDLAPAPCPAPR
jgi:tetratricopeptide (TPR) repeat protein